MAHSEISEEEFIASFREFGAAESAKNLGLSLRSIYQRRRRIEERRGISLRSPKVSGNLSIYEPNYPKRVPLEIYNGTILVGSDAHFWPGIESTAFRGFKHLGKELKPAAYILNGDVFDGARLSRHARIAWNNTPSAKQELEACQQFMGEIEDQKGKAELFWTLGNHCMRFETYLSNRAPDIEGLKGVMLKDHFPRWKHCISIWVNDDAVVKHRYKGGVHATHNNTLNAGRTILTGHLHSLKVTPFDDYNGTRWGVDTGTLMDPNGPQTEYNEDNPLNHRSGFIVLSFHKGILLQPEVCRVLGEDTIDFRGKVIKV